MNPGRFLAQRFQGLDRAQGHETQRSGFFDNTIFTKAVMSNYHL